MINYIQLGLLADCSQRRRCQILLAGDTNRLVADACAGQPGDLQSAGLVIIMAKLGRPHCGRALGIVFFLREINPSYGMDSNW